MARLRARRRRHAENGLRLRAAGRVRPQRARPEASGGSAAPDRGPGRGRVHERVGSEQAKDEQARGGESVQLSDFRALMPAHRYLFVPTGQLWPGDSVNGRFGLVGKEKASVWLDKNSPVEQLTWAPGEPREISDRLFVEGGWMPKRGVTVFNLYSPPTLARTPGDPSPWTSHVERLFGSDAGHIFRWLAHRVQRPGEKANHALILGGSQGIGKDTLLDPVKQAIGPWNWSETSPQQVLGRFNGFLKSVIMRVSEARDLGTSDRFAFYEAMKTYVAAPPDALRIDEKFTPEYMVPNVCGVIYTSNHRDGIPLPEDDRRHFVAWSGLSKESFPEDYWRGLYGWFAAGGNEAVAGHLATLDLAGFDPKAPPPRTVAFHEIVGGSRAPETNDMLDALDALGSPGVLTLSSLEAGASLPFAEWLRDGKNARQVQYRMGDCGYIRVQNPDAQNGRWRIGGAKQTVYGKREIPEDERLSAARSLR